MQEFTVFWVNHESEEIIITPNEQSQQSIYDKCGVSKSCIGLPNDCVRRRNCKKFVAVIVSNGTYTFEMQSSPSSNLSSRQFNVSVALLIYLRNFR